MMKENSVYKAAFSQADISPDFETQLIGCYRPDSRSQGVLHRLCVQVLLFENGNERFCLIAMDNLGLTVSLTAAIRKRVAERLKADISRVMINFSHTHSAPQPTADAINGERYFGLLSERTLACVENALGGLRPCKAGWAQARAGIADNRRDSCDIADDRLGALMLADAQTNEPIAVAMRIACHANILMQQNFKISSDFIGPARGELQGFFGCPVMVLQGAAGNLKPLGVEKIGGGDLGDLQRIAGLLVGAAKKLRFEPRDVQNIQMFSREMRFEAGVPSKEEAERIAANSMGQEAKWWLLAGEKLRNEGVREQRFLAEISFFILNEGGFCGISEEIFCEPALDVWARTNNPLFFLNGYTNGCMGYLASREEWYKGGFEVYQSNFIYHMFSGRLMPYRPETADLIVELAVSEWQKARGGEE